jgi:GPI mannosyltransferase 4
MGIYHQGGVIPAQLQIPKQIKFDSLSSSGNATSATVFWWKTYPPPTYLLGDKAPLNISTEPLMGLGQADMLAKLSAAAPSSCDLVAISAAKESAMVYLVAPLSSHFFDKSTFGRDTSFTTPAPQSAQDTCTVQQEGGTTLKLVLEWDYRRHINLDDVEIGEEGIWGTLSRVIGRRGIGIWRVQRHCTKTPLEVAEIDVGSGSH